MKTFWHLFQHDFRLLLRNQVIGISIIVTAIYTAAFWGLQQLGAVDRVLILTIFSDPAMLGFLFIGVMVLFEKTEHTLAALAVTPLRLRDYLLSKSLALTLISVLCCLAMVIAARGADFRWGFFVMAAFLTTMVISFIGFAVVAHHRNFNSFLLVAIAVVLLMGVPFLGYFQVLPSFWFYWFPTYPLIELFEFAFVEDLSWSRVGVHYLLTVFWLGLTYYWAYRRMQKVFMRGY